MNTAFPLRGWCVVLLACLATGCASVPDRVGTVRAQFTLQVQRAEGKSSEIFALEPTLFDDLYPSPVGRAFLETGHFAEFLPRGSYSLAASPADLFLELVWRCKVTDPRRGKLTTGGPSPLPGSAGAVVNTVELLAVLTNEVVPDWEATESTLTANVRAADGRVASYVVEAEHETVHSLALLLAAPFDDASHDEEALRILARGVVDQMIRDGMLPSGG